MFSHTPNCESNSILPVRGPCSDIDRCPAHLVSRGRRIRGRISHNGEKSGTISATNVRPIGRSVGRSVGRLCELLVGYSGASLEADKKVLMHARRHAYTDTRGTHAGYASTHACTDYMLLWSADMGAIVDDIVSVLSL